MCFVLRVARTEAVSLTVKIAPRQPEKSFFEILSDFN